MGVVGRTATRGALASLPAAIFVVYWAKMISIFAFVLWVVILAPAGAITAILMQRLFVGEIQGLWKAVGQTFVGAAIGVAAIYAEAVIILLLAPRFLPDPFALSNLLPGVMIGVIVTYMKVGGGKANAA